MSEEPKPEPKGETFTKEYVEDLRRESQGHRLKAQETQGKLDALNAEHAALKTKFDAAEAARVTAEGAALEARRGADTRIINAELRLAAQQAGLIDADDLRLVDVDALKLNDKGEVEGLTALVDGFKTSKPHLFKSPDAPPTPANNNTNPTPPPTPAPAGAKHAKDMTPEEYAAAKAQITGTTGGWR